jgi:hypothetical protein
MCQAWLEKQTHDMNSKGGRGFLPVLDVFYWTKGVACELECGKSLSK